MKKRGRKPGQTILDRAKKEVAGFADMYARLEQKIKLSGMSPGTLVNYGRCIAKISLHHKAIPMEGRHYYCL